MNLKGKQQRMLKKLLPKVMAQPCIICSGKADTLGVFAPENSQDFGAPAGKSRLVLYPICTACLVKQESIDQVEAFAEMTLANTIIQ